MQRYLRKEALSLGQVKARAYRRRLVGASGAFGALLAPERSFRTYPSGNSGPASVRRADFLSPFGPLQNEHHLRELNLIITAGCKSSVENQRSTVRQDFFPANPDSDYWKNFFSVIKIICPESQS